MKAKMPTKPAETATYLCNKCNQEFRFESGQLRCPHCGNTNKTELVIVDKRNDPQEEQLYVEDEFHGG